MQTQAVESSIEHTSIGRVVIPPGVPRGFKVFYTTIDFDGRIDQRIRDFVSPATLSSCHQVHGAKICHAPVNESECGGGRPRPPRAGEDAGHHTESECDALWTDAKNSALAIKVADCLPVSIIDPKNSVIANIHSGWRGTVQNITAATLAAIGGAPQFAFLGPTIRVCCFEVGEEVALQFDAQFVDRSLGPKPHVDIAALTTAVLRAHGIENIIDTGLCTRCGNGVARLLGGSVTEKPNNLATEQPIFHSHRRDKRSGRNLAIVAR
jgi:YfiH family protein